VNTNSLKEVVKVMNFHSLLRVDSSKRKAVELMNVSTELTKLMSRIVYNRNLMLDKNILLPEPDKPKLSIYFASDYGFCGNFNAMISQQIHKERDCYKVIIGKQIKYRDDLTLLTIDKKSFYDEFYKIERIIREAILNLSYSEINVYYNHYYNSTTFDFMSKKVFPIEFNGEYTDGEDFTLETDIQKMLSNLMSFYICYELKMYEINCYAAENVKRSIITNLSLDRLEEIEVENKAKEFKQKNEETIKKTVENYKKTMFIKKG